MRATQRQHPGRRGARRDGRARRRTPGAAGRRTEWRRRTPPPAGADAVAAAATGVAARANPDMPDRTADTRRANSRNLASSPRSRNAVADLGGPPREEAPPREAPAYEQPAPQPFEPVAREAAPEPPAHEASLPPEPPRRRSTVREPAPASSSAARGATWSPQHPTAARPARHRADEARNPRCRRSDKAAPLRLVDEARMTSMKSAWVDRDAKARSIATPRPASRRSGAAGLHHAAARRAIRRWCCTAAATPRSRRACADLLGDEPTCSASRAPAGTWRTIEPPGLPAVRLAPLQQLRALDDALRRGHGARAARQPARPDGAESIGRDAAARLPAAQIRRPHPRQRDAQPGRPAEQRGAVRGGLRRRAWASCPTSCRASARQGRGRRLRRATRRSKG